VVEDTAMLAAARSQVSTPSPILTLGSGPAAATGDIVIVNLGRHAVSAWMKSDSWSRDFMAEAAACPDQWIHIGVIPSRAPLNCAEFHQRLDPGCDLPIVELTFISLEPQDPGSGAPELTALIPYEADRNYQVLLGSTVVITARKPPA